MRTSEQMPTYVFVHNPIVFRMPALLLSTIIDLARFSRKAQTSCTHRRRTCSRTQTPSVPRALALRQICSGQQQQNRHNNRIQLRREGGSRREGGGEDRGVRSGIPVLCFGGTYDRWAQSASVKAVSDWKHAGHMPPTF